MQRDLLDSALQQASPSSDGREEQFHLANIQTFNWGTFDGYHSQDIASEGFLYVGPSGSGKSTLLDAHAALLTPPKWLGFNVAARENERGGKDRTLATYIRGAWSQQTNDNGEQVTKYLRNGTTWTAIAETYRNGNDKVVVLGRILVLRGTATANSEVKGQYFVAERAFDLRELKFFAEIQFDVRKLRATLDDLYFKDEFSPYQERFCHLLGIKSERTLRLLHKTQSAKNLGDLNEFLRDFMLDPPETFDVAEQLVKEFKTLDAAHNEVYQAREQIKLLSPARDQFRDRERKSEQLSMLREEQSAVQMYSDTRRKTLLEEEIAYVQTQLSGSTQELTSCRAREGTEKNKLEQLRDKRRGEGGDLLAQLDRQYQDLDSRRPTRVKNSELAAAACKALGWVKPQNPAHMAGLVAEARARLDAREATAQTLEQRLFEQLRTNEANEKRFGELRAEIEVMERRPSNIPSQLQLLREQLCLDTGIAEDKLPFAGELMQVKASEERWTGAIERVLRGLATSLLVEEKYYAPVTGYLEKHHLGLRFVFLLMRAHTGTAPDLKPNSLVKKLDFAPSAHQQWLREELRQHYADFECVESATALRAAWRGVTPSGQVKRNNTQHEKDDRRRIDERDNWVLGFNNAAKLASFRRQAQELAISVAGGAKAVHDMRADGRREAEMMGACQTLVNLSWEEIDIGSLLSEMADLERRIAAEKGARPELARLEADIEKQATKVRQAETARATEEARGLKLAGDIKTNETKLDKLVSTVAFVALTPIQHNALENRYNKELARVGTITLDNLDNVTLAVSRAQSREEGQLQSELAELKARIEATFTEFTRRWEKEAGGLDPKLESAPDFLAKLERLERDGLARFVDRFMELLREQSDHNLSVLHTKLDAERKAIWERLEMVNESLRGVPYNRNPETHLTISPKDRMHDHVREFRQQLRDALSHSLKDDDPDEAERRFKALNAVVQRLGSLDAVDKRWRDLVLDVRQHVDFIARELTEDGAEVETYMSGAGKSGGQRQKLTATCLAAALRYQLSGPDERWPVFSTVVMDEAFDKADAEFTKTTMNIFKEFGFQMIAATPLKGVMALEPFIGGAVFVHIENRKHSRSMAITYDRANSRLHLPTEAKRALQDELDAEPA